MKSSARLRSELKWRRKPLISFSLCLFLVLVAIAVIGRLLWLQFMALYFCEPVITRGADAAGGSLSPVEWFMILAGAALFAQLALALSGWAARNWTRTDLIIGLLNVGFAVGLLLYWIQLWSYWHPHAEIPRMMTTAVSSFGPRPKLIELGKSEFRVLGENDPAWRSLGYDVHGMVVYEHIATGVTKSYERVYDCFADPHYRSTMKRLFPNDEIDPDLSDDVYDAVLRDRNGRYIGVWRANRAMEVVQNPTARAYRRELDENPPEFSYDEFYDILMAEWAIQEYEGTGTFASEPPMSFEEFMGEYETIQAGKAERNSRKN